MAKGKYLKVYTTPHGFTDIIIQSDGDYITGLRFTALGFSEECEPAHDTSEVAVLDAAAEWLDRYFEGCPPVDLPPIKINGLTPFRKEVLQILRTIPYGEVTTYKDIAQQIARRRGLAHMSAQAVGQAIAWNPICIMIPCHRVLGSDGTLTGYSGGIENKSRLLIHEETSKPR